VDAAGCPSVLTEFRQGVPILDRVKSGRLDGGEALTRLDSLAAVIGRAHAHGLGHGSIVPGNLIVGPGAGEARLLDFGLTPLLAAEDDYATLVAADLAGLAAMAESLQRPPL
jgi:tRNA A-37 threonylcarbamoyl transferase component Bud32